MPHFKAPQILLAQKAILYDVFWQFSLSHLKSSVVLVVLDHIHEVAGQRLQEVSSVHLCEVLQRGAQAEEEMEKERGEEVMKRLRKGGTGQ